MVISKTEKGHTSYKYQFLIPLMVTKNILFASKSVMANDKYATWLDSFQWNRLRLGIMIAMIALLTFIVLNLSRYPNIILPWLYTNLSQEVALLLCLLFLHSPKGRAYSSINFLWFSWSITLIPTYWYWQSGIVKLDFVTWTLVFLGQATFLPVRWKLHLVSQLGVLVSFLVLFVVFKLPLETQIANADSTFLCLYLFWFAVICDISVYLHETLQYSEFQAKLHLQAEQDKSERLLLNILPASIAKRLKQQPTTLADDFAQVSVLFADIVGFTKISEQMSPSNLVKLLNNIFSRFDKLVDQHGLEKIKTIGDAYMVVAGLPLSCPDHVTQIADLALEMQQAVTKFNEEHNYNLRIRIGIHTGPVIAGVIGIKKFAYDLWGDTVNTASRMESHGAADCIQVSSSVYETLKDKYVLIKRGSIEIKGKGEMTTYWLEGKR